MSLRPEQPTVKRRGREAEEERCERRVHSVVAGFPEPVADKSADRCGEDPEHVEQEANADQHFAAKATASARERPRFVHDQLRLEQTLPPWSPEHAGSREAHRRVARIEEHRRDDSGNCAAAGAENGYGGKLRRSGERCRGKDE